MKLREIAEKLNLEIITGGARLDAEVGHGYASDMLSDVIGNAAEGALWITLQTHQNIVAVAVMKSLAGIILTRGRRPDEETARKAREEGITILTSNQSTFGLVAGLHRLGLTGE